MNETYNNYRFKKLSIKRNLDNFELYCEIWCWRCNLLKLKKKRKEKKNNNRNIIEKKEEIFKIKKLDGGIRFFQRKKSQTEKEKI